MTSNREQLAGRVLTVMAALPIAVAVARALQRGWTPIGDNGLLLLRAQDVLTEHHPWLGTWTSASLVSGRPLNNPGPLWFEVLAPFVQILGPSVGMAVGVALCNAGAIVLAGWAARRAGGAGAQLAVLAISAVLAWTLGSELLFDAWQPNAMVLPWWALLVGLWAVSTGVLGAAPWSVGLASLIVQTHLSFAFVIAIVGVFALVGAIFSVRLDGSAWRRPALVSGLVAMVAWAQTLVEQWFIDGNLTALATAERDDPTIGLRLGLRLIGAVVALPPWWLRSGYSGRLVATSVIITPNGPDVAEGQLIGFGLASAGLLVVVAVLAAVVVVARRRHDRAALSMAVIAGLALIGCLVSMELSPISVVGLSPHQVRWLWPVGAFVTAVPVVSVFRWWTPRAVRLGAAALVIVAVTFLNLPTYAPREGPTQDRAYLPNVQRLLAEVGGYRPDEPVLFDVSTLRFAEPYSGPVIAALARQGVDVRFEDEAMIRQTGRARRASGNERRRIALFEGDAVDDPPAGWAPVAVVRGLTSAEQRELVAARDLVIDVVEQEGLRLNEAGQAAVRAGRFDAPEVVLAPGDDASGWEASGQLAALIRDGYVDLDPHYEEQMRAYASLSERQSRYSVGLFERSP